MLKPELLSFDKLEVTLGNVLILFAPVSAIEIKDQTKIERKNK
jgi:hypothetical protein